MATYSYATYADAINALGSRLYDSAFQQWTQAELRGYLTEALRTFNALSGFWRSEMVFPTVADTWWYDLRTQPGSLVPYTVTQYEIITQIENHLLEPPTPDAWTGSQQFSLQDILTALQRRQDDTLGTAGCTISRSTPSANVGIRTILPDSVIDIRRVAWLPVAGQGYRNKILRQSDMWANRAFDTGYTTAAQAPPSTWMQNTEPPPSFDVDRVPPVPGQWDVLSVNAGGNWVAGADALVSAPDDWTWVFKWGALMDLLSRESNAKDVLRAEYCKARYMEGLALLEIMPTALALRINNIPVALDAVRNGDDFNPSWQAAGLTWAEITEHWEDADFTWEAPLGPPKQAYAAGNLIAFSPLAAGYSATVSVCQNAPVAGTYVQVPRDCFDAVIDIAHHLALFKAGGAEFAATIPLYIRAQKKAAQYNGKLKEMGFFEMPQLELSVAEEQQRPRYLPGTGPGD